MIIKGKGKSKTEMRITMIDKIDGYVFTEMEIQILASMMGTCRYLTCKLFVGKISMAGYEY